MNYGPIQPYVPAALAGSALLARQGNTLRTAYRYLQEGRKAYKAYRKFNDHSDDEFSSSDEDNIPTVAPTAAATAPPEPVPTRFQQESCQPIQRTCQHPRKYRKMYRSTYSRRARPYRKFTRTYPRRTIRYRKRFGGFSRRRGGLSVQFGATKELKYYDDFSSMEPFAANRAGTTQSCKCFNVVPLGTGVTQRVGNYFTVKSILARITLDTRWKTGSIWQHQLASPPQLIRIVIVYYKYNNGVNRLNANTLIFNMFQYVTGILPITSPFDLAKASDYKVLYDKVFSLGGAQYVSRLDAAGTATLLTDPQVIHPVLMYDERYIKCNLQVKMTGQSDVSDIDKGALYALAISSFDDAPTGATGDKMLPTVQVQTRIRFTDE